MLGSTSRAALVLLLSLVASSSSAFSQTTAPPPQRKYAYSKARWERGRYLVNNVMHCFACHSPARWDRDGLPLKGKEGSGQAAFPDPVIPFKVVVPNITPDAETGSGTWSDEQFERALRQGIGADGRTLFLMPSYYFRSISDEDLASVIVYIRSIRPVRNPLPKQQLPPEIVKLLAPLEPVPAPVPGPDPKDRVARGKYLATLASCSGCHTPSDDKFQELPGMEFGGGSPFIGPWGEVVSANITPDPSGISYYDEAMFLKVIRTGHVGARKLKPVMLWNYFRNMTDDDLKSIYAYLRTLKPVQHRVDNTEAPTYCKICRRKHGAGALNDSLVAGSTSP